MEKKYSGGWDKRLPVSDWQIFLKNKFCYQFTNKKTRKVTNFGLNTISGSKIMQKKQGSWYKVPPPPPPPELIGLNLAGFVAIEFNLTGSSSYMTFSMSFSNFITTDSIVFCVRVNSIFVSEIACVSFF